MQLENDTAHMTFYQYLKVTVSCNFQFNTFPFDFHDCDLDFGLHQNGYKMININPIQVLNSDATSEILNGKKAIPNEHLPFTFLMTSKKWYKYHNYEFMAPYSGITIHMERSTLGSLVGAFFIPTAIFSMLSIISFSIPPDLVSLNMISFF